MRRLLKLLGGFLLLLVVLAGAGVLYLQERLDTPYAGYDGERMVDIPAGAGVDRIATILADAGVVRAPWEIELVTRWSGADRGLQAGEYRFDRPLRVAEVVDKLARGDVVLHRITFPEGLTLSEMAEVFGRSDFGSADDFLAAARDPALVATVDPDAADLEGYLFPETYALPRTATARDLVRRMIERFGAVFGDELRLRAEATGLTIRQAVTLASLIEKETSQPGEHPLVSAVYHNRLRIGMGLQCDPTVIYALTRDGLYDGNLTRADLGYDSPYNTYRYPGLPPGPIASPGRTSLEAAVEPADADFLYFVSRNDGSHAFARTLREHNRNVQEFQVRYFRERRLRREGS